MTNRSFSVTARRLSLAAGFALISMTVPVAFAVPTTIVVHVLGHDSKFIGTHMGGMEITLRDYDTKEVLASGLTAGGSGDTDIILKNPHKRGQALSTQDTASYTATIDIDAPRFVELVAAGPRSLAVRSVRATAAQWILPGRDLTHRDGWFIEVRGLAVTIKAPQAAGAHVAAAKTVAVQAEVTMMCGCKIRPKDWHWVAKDFTVVARVHHAGALLGEYPLTLGKEESQYGGTVPLLESGDYRLEVVAYQGSTGNAGVDSVQITVD